MAEGIDIAATERSIIRLFISSIIADFPRARCDAAAHRPYAARGVRAGGAARDLLPVRIRSCGAPIMLSAFQ